VQAAFEVLGLSSDVFNQMIEWSLANKSVSLRLVRIVCFCFVLFFLRPLSALGCFAFGFKGFFWAGLCSDSRRRRSVLS
jgi:hypothetical protein